MYYTDKQKYSVPVIPADDTTIKYVVRFCYLDNLLSNAANSHSVMEIIWISDVGIQPLPAVKSLSVTLDQQLSFDQHAANVCKACYFHKQALRHVRLSLPDDVAKLVLVASSVQGVISATRYLLVCLL